MLAERRESALLFWKRQLHLPLDVGAGFGQPPPLGVEI